MTQPSPIQPSHRVADIVSRYPVTARVLQARRIDFCCRGEVALDDACRREGQDVGVVLAELMSVLRDAAERAHADGATELDTPALLTRIVERHHDYLRRMLPFVEPLAEKVARVHGEHNPKLIEVSREVSALCRALEPHLAYEEDVLFPALTAESVDAAMVAGELERMRAEHLSVGRALGEIREQSDGFTTPDWACRSYQALMKELFALETDILTHVHLENHVLMPRFVRAAEPASVRAAD